MLHAWMKAVPPWTPHSALWLLSHLLLLCATEAHVFGFPQRGPTAQTSAVVGHRCATLSAVTAVARGSESLTVTATRVPSLQLRSSVTRRLVCPSSGHRRRGLHVPFNVAEGQKRGQWDARRFQAALQHPSPRKCANCSGRCLRPSWHATHPRVLKRHSHYPSSTPESLPLVPRAQITTPPARVTSTRLSGLMRAHRACV